MRPPRGHMRPIRPIIGPMQPLCAGSGAELSYLLLLFGQITGQYALLLTLVFPNIPAYYQ